MSVLKNKIDFVALVSVTGANSNGDPLNGNRPRTDLNGYGEISDVCIKRKIRNRMQDLGNPIFVQSEERCTDGFKSLSQRAITTLGKNLSKEEYALSACNTWMDVRAFGQVFAYGGKKKKSEQDSDKAGDGVSVGVRGPVSIHQSKSISVVDIDSFQITKLRALSMFNWPKRLVSQRLMPKPLGSVYAPSLSMMLQLPDRTALWRL